jgi:hypothetical protein
MLLVIGGWIEEAAERIGFSAVNIVTPDIARHQR